MSIPLLLSLKNLGGHLLHFAHFCILAFFNILAYFGLFWLILTFFQFLYIDWDVVDFTEEFMVAIYCHFGYFLAVLGPILALFSTQEKMQTEIILILFTTLELNIHGLLLYNLCGFFAILANFWLLFGCFRLF